MQGEWGQGEVKDGPSSWPDAPCFPVKGTFYECVDRELILYNSLPVLNCTGQEALQTNDRAQFIVWEGSAIQGKNMVCLLDIHDKW